MACLGVHFALSEEEVVHLRSLPDNRTRLEYMQNEIEEFYFGEQPDWKAESDKSWDAMHRALSDGQLSWDGGDYPLNHTVLGGELLYTDSDYIMSLKTPSQVREIAARLPSISEGEFRSRYYSIDADSYGFPLSEVDFGYTWENFQDVRKFYTRAAAAGRFVLFTADQ